MYLSHVSSEHEIIASMPYLGWPHGYLRSSEELENYRKCNLYGPYLFFKYVLLSWQVDLSLKHRSFKAVLECVRLQHYVVEDA